MANTDLYAAHQYFGLPVAGKFPVSDFPAIEGVLRSQAVGRLVVGHASDIERKGERDLPGVRFVKPYICGGTEFINGTWTRMLDTDGKGVDQVSSITVYVLAN